MVPGPLPLAHRDDDEEGGHGEVYSGGVKGQGTAQQGAQNRAQHPVTVVHQGNGQVVVLLPHPLRRLGGRQQRISLISEGKDHIELPQPHPPELFQHRQAVEHVPEVQQQGHQSRLKGGGPRGQQSHPHVLSGPGIDDQAHQQGPEHTVSRRIHHQAEGHPDGQIAHQHRNGDMESGGEDVSIHLSHSPHSGGAVC